MSDEEGSIRASEGHCSWHARMAAVLVNPHGRAPRACTPAMADIDIFLAVFGALKWAFVRVIAHTIA